MTSLITAGLELMLVGMLIVFLFLALLVGAVNIMSGVLRRFFPEAPLLAPLIDRGASDAGITAAITAAVHRYRATHKH